MDRNNFKLSDGNDSFLMSAKDFNKAIDAIFDEIESRTCESCKRFHGIENGQIKCYSFHYISTGYDFIDAEDFGCNKWESK